MNDQLTETSQLELFMLPFEKRIQILETNHQQ